MKNSATLRRFNIFVAVILTIVTLAVLGAALWYEVRKQPKRGIVIVTALLSGGLVEVKDDGTEEILKPTLTTENGVTVTLTDGDTVKIVDNTKTFLDVPAGYWGADAVAFAASRELFNGTSETAFSPDRAMNRAMFVTVLARLEGVDTSAGEPWYAAGQQWAMEYGISDGSNMERNLTREQLVTMLWRYAGSPAPGTGLEGYTDAGSVSAYARQAMAWAVEQGIVAGTSDTTLTPQGNATRAQVAAILMRYIGVTAR